MGQMSFLQICQFVSARSGTISGTLPLTVIGQTGRLKKVVDNTATAFRKLQNLHPDQWRFLRKEFTQALQSGTGKYSGVTLGLADHSRWMTGKDNIYSIYDPAIGVSDERGVDGVISWEEWRYKYSRGTQVQGPPGEYAISPAGELCVGPIPDKNYVMRGEYWRTNQDLALDADVPIIPANFHEIIGWAGLMILAKDDEANVQIGTATSEYAGLLSQLEFTQLETLSFAAEPLA